MSRTELSRLGFAFSRRAIYGASVRRCVHQSGEIYRLRAYRPRSCLPHVSRLLFAVRRGNRARTYHATGRDSGQCSSHNSQPFNTTYRTVSGTPPAVNDDFAAPRIKLSDATCRLVRPAECDRAGNAARGGSDSIGRRGRGPARPGPARVGSPRGGWEEQRPAESRIRSGACRHRTPPSDTPPQRRGPDSHDEIVNPETLNTVCVADFATTFVGEGQAAMFIIVDHSDTEWIGIHASDAVGSAGTDPRGHTPTRRYDRGAPSGTANIP